MDKGGDAGKDKSYLKYLPTFFSAIALSASVGLQFIKYAAPVIGNTSVAMSGATIIAVSIVFTGLALLVAYYQLQRIDLREDALDEMSEVTSLILRGQALATSITTRQDSLSNIKAK